MLERKQLGHYRLMQHIGGGGMGEIYVAQDTRIERQVALKVVRSEVAPYPDAAATADMQRLFLREMQAITRLDHPRILPLYDFGEERDGNNVVTYMVMPYRPEGSLNDWLQKRGSVARLSFQDVAYFIGQAAEALQHAHDHALIHQDVKTSNFLVRDHPGLPLPDLLLSDFGIARVMSATATASQSVRGTPNSMAPEQWQGYPEPATDQYALAIMAYILLTGRPPFSGRMEQLLHQHLSVLPVPPSTFNPAIPRDLDSVILTALAKEPGRRFGSVSAFGRAFQLAANVAGLALPFVGNPATPAPLAQQAPDGPSPVLPLAMPSFSAPANLASPPATPSFAPPIPLTTPAAFPEAANATPSPATPPVAPYSFTPSPPVLPQPGSYPQVSNADAYLPTVPPAAQVASPPFPPQQAVVLPPVQEPPPASYPLFQSQPAYPPYQEPAPVYPSYQQSAPVYPQYQYAQATPLQPPAATPGQPARLKQWLIAGGLAVVLIVAGIISASVIYQNRLASDNATATTSAQSTSSAQSTVQARATQAVQATSTAIASQATADAQATVNAQASATAQVIASNPYPSYMSGSGKLILIDSLQGPNTWRQESDTSFGGSCQFSNSAYHISQTKPQSVYYCEGNTQMLSNFALEVQMTVVQGDCGGMMVRINQSKTYYFRVCANGDYRIIKYVDNSGTNAVTLATGTTGVVSASGANTLGIVANGASLTLYVNQQRVDGANDNSFASGSIALTAESITNPTEVSYSNIRVWA
ncbi:MAG TPA: protein kinase [Ktedonobacteraceae bacterium]